MYQVGQVRLWKYHRSEPYQKLLSMNNMAASNIIPNADLAGDKSYN